MEIYRGKNLLKDLLIKYPDNLKEFIMNRAYYNLKNSLKFGKQSR